MLSVLAIAAAIYAIASDLSQWIDANKPLGYILRR
jgi:hypothetical protein